MNRFTLLELEDYIRAIDARDYASQRNYLGHSTRLSEYITRGYISLPRVRSLILENNTPSAAYKLINELTWREYWHSAWIAKGDGIFEYIRPLPHPVRRGLPTSIINAQTGINAIDDGITELKETGYIHNHMRMWLAGVITNVARCEWKDGADWMHAYLIDGDYASNHLSWQWVAGSYTGKPYLPQQDNINKYANTLQQGTFLDKPYSKIADMPIPDELQELTTNLPAHTATMPLSTVSIAELRQSSDILLYSPWTLDPTWRQDSNAVRVLLLDQTMFRQGAFSQPVIDSIMWFANQIPNVRILIASPQDVATLPAAITRQSYPGINWWPGQVDQSDKLFPDMPAKFYPSFSAFWKQTQK